MEASLINHATGWYEPGHPVIEADWYLAITPTGAVLAGFDPDGNKTHLEEGPITRDENQRIHIGNLASTNLDTTIATIPLQNGDTITQRRLSTELPNHETTWFPTITKHGTTIIIHHLNGTTETHETTQPTKRDTCPVCGACSPCKRNSCRRPDCPKHNH